MVTGLQNLGASFQKHDLRVLGDLEKARVDFKGSPHPPFVTVLHLKFPLQSLSLLHASTERYVASFIEEMEAVCVLC